MLNFVMTIVAQGRSFISCLLVFLSQAQDPNQVFRMDQAAIADLAMWGEFLENWNGVSMLIPVALALSPPVVTDAAAYTGFIAIFGPYWFTGPWPQEILLIPGFS